eukprot:866144-Rhodomonas_salina.2
MVHVRYLESSEAGSVKGSEVAARERVHVASEGIPASDGEREPDEDDEEHEVEQRPRRGHCGEEQVEQRREVGHEPIQAEGWQQRQQR